MGNLWHILGLGVKQDMPITAVHFRNTKNNPSFFHDLCVACWASECPLHRCSSGCSYRCHMKLEIYILNCVHLQCRPCARCMSKHAPPLHALHLCTSCDIQYWITVLIVGRRLPIMLRPYKHFISVRLATYNIESLCWSLGGVSLFFKIWNKLEKYSSKFINVPSWVWQVKDDKACFIMN